MEGEIKWPRISPGQLMQRFMDELGATPQEVAAKTRLPMACVTGIMEGRHAVSKREAKRLKRFFGGSTQLWLNLQAELRLPRGQRKRTTPWRGSVPTASGELI